MGNATQTYWYNLSTGLVERHDQRPSEDTIGPFATAQEAEDSPAQLLAHAQAWLSSDESEEFRRMAEENGDTGANGYV